MTSSARRTVSSCLRLLVRLLVRRRRPPGPGAAPPSGPRGPRRARSSRFIVVLLESDPCLRPRDGAGNCLMTQCSKQIDGMNERDVIARTYRRFQRVWPAAGLSGASGGFEGRSSLSWMPPKPPFERIATRSPGPERSATSVRTISSTVGTKAAVAALPPDARDELGLREPLALGHLPRQVRGGDDHAVGAGERAGEVVLEDARAWPCTSAARTRPRGARLAPERPQRRERRRDRRRVVGEVVVDRDAPGLAAHLEPALDPLEAPPAPRARPRARRRPRPRPRAPPARCGRCARRPSAG